MKYDIQERTYGSMLSNAFSLIGGYFTSNPNPGQTTFKNPEQYELKLKQPTTEGSEGRKGSFKEEEATYVMPARRKTVSEGVTPNHYQPSNAKKYHAADYMYNGMRLQDTERAYTGYLKGW